MGERNFFNYAKIPVWGTTDDSGVKMTQQCATPHLSNGGDVHNGMIIWAS
jgi:hypothetical protein